MNGKASEGEARVYRTLMRLAEKQLTAIGARLSGTGTDYIPALLFRMRHKRIQHLLKKLLRSKESVHRDQEKSVLAVIEDLKEIGEGKRVGYKGTKKESDYLRFVLHGIRAAPVREGGMSEQERAGDEMKKRVGDNPGC